MKDFLKPSLVLFGTGLVSGLLLAFVFSAAKPVIDKNELKEKEEKCFKNSVDCRLI